MFDAFFNTIFGPLLNLGALVTVLILSLLVSLLMVFIYKWMTNQHEMKQLKGDLKKYQKRMRELRKDPEKFMEVQKKANKLNIKYMKESFKPTLVTFIPIIIIFGWMNAHLYYEPISPGQNFVVDVFVDKNLKGNVSVEVDEGLDVIGDSNKAVNNDKATFTFKGSQGEHWMTFNFLDASVQKNVLLTNELAYVPPIENFEEQIKTVAIHQNKLKILFGLSWLWSYIIFAVVFSMILRKLLKVY